MDDSGQNFGETGSGQKQNQRAEVDTSAPFESVMEAVTRFGGIGFWKKHLPNPSPPSQTNNEKEEDETTQPQNDVVPEEGETQEILKEIEATKTRFEELKVKLEKEVKINTHPSDDQTKVQVDEALSKTEILKRVEEATKEVKSCTRVLEEALSRVEAARHDMNDCDVLVSGPILSIGQILSRKLVLAEERSKKNSMTWKVSLAQILSKSRSGEKRGGRCEKEGSAKRMKFGFGGMSFIVAKPKKSKKQSRC